MQTIQLCLPLNYLPVPFFPPLKPPLKTFKSALWWVSLEFSYPLCPLCPCPSRPYSHILNWCDRGWAFQIISERGGQWMWHIKPCSCFLGWFKCSLTLRFSQHLTAPLVAISLVKDCPFSLLVVSQTQIMSLPSSVCRKSPARPWGLETFRTTGNIQRKTFPLSATPPSLSLSPPPPSRFLTGNGSETRELEKGQRCVREKHRWLSDGLALSDLDSPTRSHLRGHFHETKRSVHNFTQQLKWWHTHTFF